MSRSRGVLLLLAVAVCAIAPQPAAAKPVATAASSARGQFSLPTPAADLGIQTLTDQKDADYFSGAPLLSKAYPRVTLTNLDGSGSLTGDYAKVIPKTGKAATATGDGFIYTRDQDE